MSLLCMAWRQSSGAGHFLPCRASVSYTHLDVYKRQEGAVTVRHGENPVSVGVYGHGFPQRAPCLLYTSPERESIESFAAHGASMAIFLSTGMLEELSSRLIAGGYAEDTPAAIVYKATWPDEKTCVCTVGTLAETAREAGITKTALILVGQAVAHRRYNRSELYQDVYKRQGSGSGSGGSGLARRS